MPLQLNNRFFQNSFDGFALHGRGQCVTTVEYDVGIPATTFSSARGGNIVVLDDPAFDPQSGRPRGNGFPDPCDTSHFSIGSSRGVDGSILECRDVKISADSALWFVWSFLPVESHTSNTFNSFALFAAYDECDLGGDGDFSTAMPVHTAVLGQSKNLPDSSRPTLSWRVAAWQPQQSFSGTLLWVVSTGTFAVTNSQCRPSMLLLDSIDINRCN